MSRTVRRLPVGNSKKYGRIGYYNFSRRFAPSEINVLKKKPKAQWYARSIRRRGLFLFPPGSASWCLGRGIRSPYPDYAIDEPRSQKHSIRGPKWVDEADFNSDVIQALIDRDWYFHHRYEERVTGPEWGDREYVRCGPDFREHRIWFVNPEFDEELDDEYRHWKSVHKFVHRNGHYKGRHPGRNWRRRQKQDDHQLTRRRLKVALYKELNMDR